MATAVVHRLRQVVFSGPPRQKSADPFAGSPGVGDCSSPLPHPLWTDIDGFEGEAQWAPGT